MKPERLLARAKIRLLIDHPFFGHLIMSGLKFVEDAHMPMPTMATDGNTCWYDPTFVANTPTEQLEGVLAHEAMHCILMHPPRRQGREPRKWNYATDYAVNDIILKEFKLPDGCLVPPQAFQNQTAEFIYARIPDQKQDGNATGETLDGHGKWDNWGKGAESGDKNKEGNQPGQGEGNDSGDQQTAQKWRELVATAEANARMAGKMPAHLKTVVGEFLQPKLDWKTILRDMITSCAKNNYTWSPPNKKHVHRGIYLPGLTGEEISVAVCVDSSGSISDENIREFLSEIKGICDTYDEYTIYLFIADTVVHERYTIQTMDPLPTVVSGRGGTDFGPALKEADEKEATAIVYLTDLEPNHWNVRQPRLPVIWVSTTDMKVPWGSKIILPERSS